MDRWAAANLHVWLYTALCIVLGVWSLEDGFYGLGVMFAAYWMPNEP
jgi:hypothetical protein